MLCTASVLDDGVLIEVAGFGLGGRSSTTQCHALAGALARQEVVAKTHSEGPGRGFRLGAVAQRRSVHRTGRAA